MKIELYKDDLLDRFKELSISEIKLDHFKYPLLGSGYERANTIQYFSGTETKVFKNVEFTCGSIK